MFIKAIAAVRTPHHNFVFSLRYADVLLAKQFVRVAVGAIAAALALSGQENDKRAYQGILLDGQGRGVVGAVVDLQSVEDTRRPLPH
jgi:hypothetical protein